MSYLRDAIDDAAGLAEEFKGQIIQQLKDKGKASNDFRNDYDGADSFFHESYVDRSYSLTEADELLSDLYEYEETDEGMWAGLKPRQAISAQAAWTYGNAVEMWWRKLIEQINEAYEHRDEVELCDDDEEKEEISPEHIVKTEIANFKE